MSVLKSSAELQEIVLASLMKDAYMLSNVKAEVNESFFSGAKFRLIYKALKQHHDKYGTLPQIRELVVTIQEMYTVTYGELPDIQEEAVKLFNSEPMNEAFVIEKLTTFIKRNKVEGAMRNIIPLIKEGKDYGVENAADLLIESLSVNLSKSAVFTLSNTEELPDVKSKAIGDEDNPLIIKSCLEPINQALQFKGYKPGDLIMPVAAPGVGKTSYLTNEGSHAARQGFNVLNVYIGDMTEYDGFVRYLSCLSGVLQDEIALMPTEQQQALVQHTNMASNGALNRISLMSYAANEIGVDALIENIFKSQEQFSIHYDMIIIDYADNLIRESTMMYESGGAIYNKLSMMGRTNRSITMVASQPKVAYWDKEIIPKEGAAESSQKQHVIDLMITFGKPTADANIGTMFLPKVRRGQAGKLVRVQTMWEKCQMKAITEQEYVKAKAAILN